MKIFYSFLVVAVCYASGFAQVKVIDKDEFDAKVQSAAENDAQYLIGKPCRITVSTETRNSKRPELDYTSKLTSERAIDGSTRGARDSTFGTTRNNGESVKIGSDRYERKNSGSWEKLGPPRAEGPTPPPPANGTAVLSSDIEYRFLGTETLKGETARTYLKIERRTEIDKVKGDERKNETTTKYWIAPDGHLMKSDFLSTTTYADAITTVKVIVEYEIDPSITITAPTIVAASVPVNAN